MCPVRFRDGRDGAQSVRIQPHSLSGPVYSKRGSRMIYDIADLETWMEEGKRRFTAEAAD